MSSIRRYQVIPVWGREGRICHPIHFRRLDQSNQSSLHMQRQSFLSEVFNFILKTQKMHPQRSRYVKTRENTFRIFLPQW